MSDQRPGFPCMGEGIRVLTREPFLDPLLAAVQEHADCRMPIANIADVEDLLRQHEGRDRKLYEVAKPLRLKVDKAWPGVVFADDLLEAIERHSKRRPENLELADTAKRLQSRDAELYDCASLLRSEALLGADEGGVCIEKSTLDVLLKGGKAVTRIPVEINAAGVPVPEHYEVGGGPNGSYALAVLTGGKRGDGLRVVAEHRVKVLGLRREPLDALSDEDATLEGSADRIKRLAAWQERHGEFDLTWPVWRYELVLAKP